MAKIKTVRYSYEVRRSVNYQSVAVRMDMEAEVEDGDDAKRVYQELRRDVVTRVNDDAKRAVQALEAAL